MDTVETQSFGPAVSSSFNTDRSTAFTPAGSNSIALVERQTRETERSRVTERRSRVTERRSRETERPSRETDSRDRVKSVVCACMRGGYSGLHVLGLYVPILPIPSAAPRPSLCSPPENPQHPAPAHLHHNQVGDAGAGALAERLRGLESLQKLDLL